MPRYALFQPRATAEQLWNPQCLDAIANAYLGKPDEALFAGLYHQVALIEAPDPEALFEITQSFNGNWYESPSTLWYEKPLRSGSAGDFIYDVVTREMLVCAAIGWNPVSAHTKLKLVARLRHVEPSSA